MTLPDVLYLARPKEAAKECSNALAIAPGNAKALLWRSKAYEAQGLYKQALSDVQALNKTADATPDSQSSEQRLKDIMSGATIFLLSSRLSLRPP